MGEVYRASDTRLGRDVAIKILSPRIAADREAVVRFEREARALATLNHPNIAAIYDVIESGGQPALILELVEGETLAERIAQGSVSMAEALDYARQIADALDVAHEAGIVHRDLKPGNIKVTEDGRIKVLDFGLAKALAAAAGDSLEADAANSPTITVHGTGQGVILGTAAYMSPEQARGKRIDKRTDIWAFGCVLFEMLTRRPVFAGETTSDVIAAIIERAPDLSRLPATTPPRVRRAIARCLEKDPKRRARDIADVRAELDADEREAAVPARRSSMALAALAAALAVAGVGIGTLLSRPSPAAPEPPLEFTFTAPEGHVLMATPVPSPDGRHIAFIARDDRQVTSIWLRPIDASTLRRLEGTEGATNAFGWSPDSRALAFFVGGSWKRINIDGGPAVTIALNSAGNLGVSWGPGDVLLVAPANRTALARLPAAGGPLQPVTTLDTEKENSHRWPQWLPDGRHFLFTVRSDSPERLGIKVGSVDSSDTRLLVNTASQGIYTEPGRLLFMTPDNVVMAQSLDPATWTLTGSPQPVAGSVRYNGPSFNGSFGASRDGKVLTYVPALRSAATLEWFDRSGKPLGHVGPEGPYRGIRLAPNRKHIAVELADDRYGTRDIWIVDTTSQALTRQTSHAATDWRAVFLPDGLSLTFASDRAGRSTVFRTLIGSAGGETAMYRNEAGGAFPSDWSRDGQQLLVTVDDAQGRERGLVIVSADGHTVAQVVGTGMMSARFSPIGDRIAFASRETGRPEIYVMSLRDRQRVRISTDGGSNPAWGADGREVFFLSAGNEIMSARFDASGTAAKPEVLFRPCAALGRAFAAAEAEQSYDVSADGTRFITVCEPSDARPSAMTVVVNWQSKLR